MNPRIGLVVPDLAAGGGVSTVARFISNAAIRHGGYQLKLVSLATASDDSCNLGLGSPRSWLRGPATEDREWGSFAYVHVGATAGELEFQRYRRRAVLTRLLADCDAIQVVCGTPAWANAVLGLDKPVAVHIFTRARVERRRRDATRGGGSRDWWRRCMTTFTDRLDDRALRRADAIQVANQWMLDYAHSLNVGRDVDVTHAPPGINTRHFRPLDGARGSSPPYILCVARFADPRKNIGLLLEAYARLPNRVRDRVELVLAGSTPPPESFWRRASDLDLSERVRYVQRPDSDALLRLYQHASVFALPSDEEGFGMVLLEAMACGVPVVSTRSGGPDNIIRDGEDGYLVGLDDARALSSRLLRLLEEPDHNARMGAAARLSAEQRFSDHVTGAAFIATWDRLLHARTSSQCASGSSQA